MKELELKSPKILLRNGNFFRVWFSGFLFGTARWLDVLAVSIFVFDITGSPFTVAITMFVRMLPMLLFGAYAGAFAETVDGRKLLIFGLIIIVLVYGVLGLLAWNQILSISQLVVGVFISGIFWTLELPIRRTMVAEIAGIQNISTAMGLDTATNNFTRMLGPFSGGFFYEISGLHGALALGGSLYLLSAILLLFVEYERNSWRHKNQSIFKNIAQGIRYARSNKIIMAAFCVTIIFNLFGFSCVSMVPVIARQELNLSAFAIGILSSGEGVGAFLGSILVAYFVVRARFNQVYFFGAILYLLGLSIFAISNLYWVSLVAICLGGAGIAGFASMQAAIIISNAPFEMRTRLMGVLTMCIGTGPVGILILGILANYLGAAFGVFIITMSGLTALLISGLTWPQLLTRKTV